MANDRLDRFTTKAGEMTVSQCIFCKHNIPGTRGCAAFPEVIPLEIRMNKFDHRLPYANDNGIQFELIEDLPETAGEPTHLVE